MNYVIVPGLKKSANWRRDVVDFMPNRMEVIITEVTNYYNVSQLSMISRTRKKEICHARQVCMYLACIKTNISLLNIGRMFDRDHTTVMHSRDHIKDLMFSDPLVKEDIDKLSNKL